MENEVNIETKTIQIKELILITKNYIYLIIKRIFDIIVSLISIIVLIPISIIVKIAHMCNKDFTAIFYKQIRIGKNGKKFKLYKFRTMIPNADEKLKEILKKNKKLAREWKKSHKLSNDPRITKIGKILRMSSIDELPQFINILKGDMSLIGPRPLVEGELDEHGGNHQIYERVKPGITGWWACNGRSDIPYDERLDLEYYYINNRGILLDLKCILKTISVVIFRNGAK